MNLCIFFVHFSLEFKSLIDHFVSLSALIVKLSIDLFDNCFHLVDISIVPFNDLFSLKNLLFELFLPLFHRFELFSYITSYVLNTLNLLILVKNITFLLLNCHQHFLQTLFVVKDHITVVGALGWKTCHWVESKRFLFLHLLVILRIRRH